MAYPQNLTYPQTLANPNQVYSVPPREYSPDLESPWIMKGIGRESEYESRTRDLLQRTGYRLSQKCGQSIYSEPPNWTGPPPSRGSEVFLCIARGTFMYDLEPILSQFGKIYELRLMVDFSGTSRGFAYVKYASPEVARAAVVGINLFRSRAVIKKASISDDNSIIFVQGIPPHLSRDDLYEFFSKKTERLCSVLVSPSRSNLRPNRGFCFLEYANHSFAAQARRELLQDMHVQEWRTDLTAVSWGIPYKLKYPAPENSRKIYVCNLPLHYNYSKLLHHLAQHTDISYVMNGKVSNGKGFLEFTQHDEANYALHILTGFKIDDHTLSASWARPMQRSRDRDQILNTHADTNANRLRAVRAGSDDSSIHSVYSTSDVECMTSPHPYAGDNDNDANHYSAVHSYSTPNTGSGSYPDAESYGDIAGSSSYSNYPYQDPVAGLNQSVANLQLSGSVPTNPRYRGATPLPDVMATRFVAVQNVNYRSSLSPYSPVTPVAYPQYNLWSPQPLSAPSSSAFVYPPPTSSMYRPVMSPVPSSPSTPVYNSSGNYFFF